MESLSVSESRAHEASAMPQHPNGVSQSGGTPRESEAISVLGDTSTILHGDLLKPDGGGFKTREVLLDYLTRLHDQLKDCYVAIRLSRGSVKEAWERFRRYHQAYQKSRWLYDDAIDPASVQYAFPDSADRMNSLRQGLTEARDIAEQQFVEAKDLELQFKLNEERLERKQDKFLAAAERFMSLATAGAADDLFSDFDSEAGFPVSPFSARSAASRQMDPRQERYYESASDVKLMRERLADLDERYRENRIYRNMRQDQGDELSVTDSDFEAENARKRTVLKNELDLAMATTAQRHDECIELGLEIDASGPNNTDTEALTGPSTRGDSHTQYDEGTIIEFHPSLDDQVFSDTGDSRLDALVNGRLDVLSGAGIDELGATKGPLDISGWVDNVGASAVRENGQSHIEDVPTIDKVDRRPLPSAIRESSATSQQRMRRRASEPELRRPASFLPDTRETAITILQR